MQGQPFFKPRRFHFLSLGLTSSLLFACNFYEVKDNQTTTTTIDPTKKFSYADVKESIFDPHCTSCHGAQNPNLESYGAVVAAKDGVITQSIVRKTMPKGYTLTADEIAMLQAWYDQGAPETVPQ